ncbi:MAG: pentapeptide repeat-containing protein [Leptolyngbyaceae cyanobacterium bins.349]|nr:pentapeptide repeat-containing protein [Leptolyngbyaceae cyanobacterium bins.349]
MAFFKHSRKTQALDSLTDEQIQAKAYEMWEARGKQEGSPEADWQAAIAALQAESLNNKNWEQFGDQDDREFALKVKQFQWERIKTIISAFGLGATAIAAAGLFFTYLNAQKEQQLNTERLITDRFTKAVEQLGHQDIAVRIGGIYALERIAKDSPKDHWTVMEILTAFVRERSPIGSIKPTQERAKVTEIRSVATDVQVALTTIGRRDTSRDLDGAILSFQRTNLTNANLYRANLRMSFFPSANLQQAYFPFANLRGANLTNANLLRANFTAANLQLAVLSSANLESASFEQADLEGANLMNSNLQQADLTFANLRGVSLYGANLRKAKLFNVNLHGVFLSDEQLAQALFCETTMPNGTISKRDCRRRMG